MITIIHGDDVNSSRNYYLEERQKFKNPLIFDGKNVTAGDLIQSLSGNSLFDQGSEIFIENFFSSKKINPEFKSIVGLLEKTNQAKIYLWEDEELSKTDTAVFKSSFLKLFKIPQNMFGFLDNIKPGNTDSIKQFHILLNQTAEELVFFMLIRQFRLLLAVSDVSGEQIDEVKRLAPWQVSRLKSQSKLFGEEKLLKAYKKLSEIDLFQKSGKLATSLTQAIDFFLVGL